MCLVGIMTSTTSLYSKPNILKELISVFALKDLGL